MLTAGLARSRESWVTDGPTPISLSKWLFRESKEGMGRGCGELFHRAGSSLGRDWLISSTYIGPAPRAALNAETLEGQWIMGRWITDGGMHE